VNIVASWIFSNNESNFAHLFCQQFKRFSDACQLPSHYLNWVFKMSTSCSNIWSKSLSKMTGLSYQWTRGKSLLGNVGRFWRAFFIASQHHAPYVVIIQWIEIWRIRWPFVIFQWNRSISSRSSLGQELLCEQVRHLAERWSCPIGDACSLWLDLAAA